MTDKDIMDALEFCKDCSININWEIIDLISRQQAEIERLTNYNRCIDAQCRDLLDKEEKAKAKAIKEFAEKLKDVFVTIDGTFECWEIEEHIDNIVEEMGAGNETLVR